MIHKFELTVDLEAEMAGDLLLDFCELVDQAGELCAAFVEQEKEEA